MKKVFFKYKLLVLTLALGFGACTDNFEEINQNPNSPTVVPTAYLLTQAQRSTVSYILDQTDGWNDYGMHFSQQMSQTQYAAITRYENTESDFAAWFAGSTFNTGSNAIRGPLANFAEIMKINSDPDLAATQVSSGSTNNQLAVARIMKVLAFQHITDFWGDIPYSEALQGRDNFQPAYDAQSDIYADFVKELKEATAQIDGGLGVQGDVIYEGDMDKWKMFASSLLLRVGIRMSNANPSLAQDAITTALTNGVFASNDDHAMYNFLADANNANPMYRHFVVDSRTDYAISDVMVNMLKSFDDPRLPIFADPASEPIDPNDPFVGMPYGVTNAEAGSITNAEISFPGSKLRDATSPGYILTYAEVLFIQAEAAERGWISGDAAVLYEQAIRASMEQWGVASDDIDTYLANPDVAYDGLKSIGYQKYFALYMTGLEAYSEFRRTGFPELQPAPAAVLDRQIPRRLGYPQAEKDLNGDNVAAAIARMGGDELETRVWWDGGN